MDVEAKKKAILKALKIFSQMQLDPKGKGRNILSLERGERISEAKIEEIYETMLTLQKETAEKGKVLDKTVRQSVRQKAPNLLDKVLDKKEALLLDKVLDKIQEKFQQLEKKVQELESMVDLLLAKQKGLEDRLASLESGSIAQKDNPKGKEQGKDSQAKKLLGFALVQKSTSSQGKRYQKWYAVKRIKGKQVWAYIGEDVGKAEEKIKQWLASHV